MCLIVSEEWVRHGVRGYVEGIGEGEVVGTWIGMNNEKRQFAFFSKKEKENLCTH